MNIFEFTYKDDSTFEFESVDGRALKAYMSDGFIRIVLLANGKEFFLYNLDSNDEDNTVRILRILSTSSLYEILLETKLLGYYSDINSEPIAMIYNYYDRQEQMGMNSGMRES